MSLWDWLQNASAAWLKRPYISIDVRFSETGYTKPKENNMPPEYVYFKPEEVEGLDANFVAKLDLARKFAQIPFVITSGLRTLTQNEQTAGSVHDSAHLTGKAVDLRVDNDHEVYLILAAGISVGITRYGIYINSDGKPTHVHIDVANDDAHVPEVIWIKGEGKPNSAPATA